MPPVRVAAPSVHIVQSTRVLLAAAPTTPPCFRHWRRSSLLPTRGGLGKEVRLCEMPRAPLLGGLSPQVTGGLPPAAAAGKPHRHPFGMPPVRVAAPSVHIVQSTRVLLAAAPTTPPCFRHWRRSSLLPTRGGLGKEVRLYEMPRAPLLAGAVAAGDWGVAPSSCCRKTPPSSLRDATAPNRGGLGKEVRLYEMPRAPLLGGLSPQVTGGFSPSSRCR